MAIVIRTIERQRQIELAQVTGARHTTPGLLRPGQCGQEQRGQLVASLASGADDRCALGAAAGKQIGGNTSCRAGTELRQVTVVEEKRGHVAGSSATGLSAYETSA